MKPYKARISLWQNEHGSLSIKVKDEAALASLRQELTNMAAQLEVGQYVAVRPNPFKRGDRSPTHLLDAYFPTPRATDAEPAAPTSASKF
jgi:hypothetical protein